MSISSRFSTYGLLFGAVVWGIIWYPYRLLSELGIQGVQSSLGTYSVAMLVGLFLVPTHWRVIRQSPLSIGLIALAAGWTNLAYVLAVLDGEVMRVLLLFYLSPLWTLILARIFLGEKVGFKGLGVTLLSLGGMLIMLWDVHGLPIPQKLSEWLALSAGFCFSFSNVITRGATHLSLTVKSLAVWFGVSVISLVAFNLDSASAVPWGNITPLTWVMLVAIGLTLALTTWMVQWGVTHVPPNRAAAIFMSELVVAAISSYWLAGEQMNLRDWIGGSLIVAAMVFAESQWDRSSTEQS